MKVELHGYQYSVAIGSEVVAVSQLFCVLKIGVSIFCLFLRFFLL